MTGDRHLRFDALIVALSAVLVVGGYVLVWADGQGLVSGNQLFSIWAVPLYVGFGTAAYILLLAWIRRRGRRPDAELAKEYRFAVAGAAVFIVALLAEFVWGSVGGRPDQGAEGVLSPTRLALFAGTILVVSGPLLSLAAHRGPRATEGDAASRRPDGAALIAAVAFGLVLSVLTLLLGFVNPFVIRAGSSENTSSPQAATDLYLVPLDGSGSRRLTTTRDLYEAHPDVSADGNQIAFARGAIDDFRLYTMGITGSDQRLVAASESHQDGPLWLPNGAGLSFWAEIETTGSSGPNPSGPAPAPGPSGAVSAPIEASGLGIWTVSGPGATPKILDGHSGEGAESWTVAADRFCGWSFASGTLDIAVWNAAGGERTVIAGGPSNEWACSWSPDGGRIAFHSDRDGDFEIYTVAPDGSDLRQLTDDPGIDQLARWSPDGTQLAYISTRGGEFEIYVAKGDGSNPRDVTNDPALDDGFYGIAWLPDGSGLVAASSGRTYSLSADVSVPLGTASLVLMAVIVAGVMLMAWRFAPGVVGVLTVACLINGALLAFLSGEVLFVVPLPVAGLLGDAFLWRYGRADSEDNLLPALGLAAVVAFGFAATYFAVLGLTDGVAWTADLVLGVVLVATLVAAGTAVLLAAPLQPHQRRIE